MNTPRTYKINIQRWLIIISNQHYLKKCICEFTKINEDHINAKLSDKSKFMAEIECRPKKTGPKTCQIVCLGPDTDLKF